MVTSPQPIHHGARLAMWLGFAAAGLTLVALLAVGWRRADALAVASGVLFLVCVGTCIWAWILGERTWKHTLEELQTRVRALREDEPQRRL